MGAQTVHVPQTTKILARWNWLEITGRLFWSEICQTHGIKTFQVSEVWCQVLAKVAFLLTLLIYGVEEQKSTKS
jgi:hypothetical protein